MWHLIDVQEDNADRDFKPANGRAPGIRCILLNYYIKPQRHSREFNLARHRSESLGVIVSAPTTVIVRSDLD